ncbi:MAG: hypothetical protein ABI068_17250 [Ktedonobacterales bacterium]
MIRALEVLFQHKWRLLALLLAPIIISELVVLALPRQYQATASLWALRRYEIIGATGPESDLQSTPSATQATALTELLQTRSFDLAVAYDTDLPKHMGGDINSTSQNTQDAIFSNLSAGVLVTTPGYNLLVITYTNGDPLVAQQVVNAVISHYGQQSGSHALAEGQQLLAAYKVQLAQAQKAADDATQAATQYLQVHQLTAVTAQSDPQYQLLSAQAAQARATLGNIQASIDTINQELATLSTGATGLYTIADSPEAGRPSSRSKTLLYGGGIGLAIALIASIGYILLLLRINQSIYSAAELSECTPYPVLAQVPQLPRRVATNVAGASIQAAPDRTAS